jgi:hypothetical protein
LGCKAAADGGGGDDNGDGEHDFIKPTINILLTVSFNFLIYRLRIIVGIHVVKII